MRFLLLVSIVSFFGCTQEPREPRVTEMEIVELDTQSYEIPQNYDTTLMTISLGVLKVLQTKEFEKLSKVTFKTGIRFSPYGYIDTARHKVLTLAELQKLKKSDEEIIWGEFDGSGEPIKLSLDDYFEKFVWDRDFSKAPQKGIDTILGTGNSLINITDIYPGASFVEFYYPGTDPRYNGMDWSSLRLVFLRNRNFPILVAIVHDQWTI